MDDDRAVRPKVGVPDLGPHDRVLRAAKDIILERGLTNLRLAEIGRRTHMSTGHVLYYFGTKDRILIETLKWIEEDLAVQRRVKIADALPGWGQLRVFIDCYLPVGVDDPVWALWLEAWAQRHREAYATEVSQSAAAWDRDLRALLRRGRQGGQFAGGAGSFSKRLIVLMDGLAIQILQGTRDRADALRLTKEQCQLEL